MTDFLFNAIPILMVSVVTIAYLLIIAYMYRRVRFSQVLNQRERQIVSLQTLAFALWIFGLLGLTAYAGSASHPERVYALPTVRIAVLFAHWVFLGFISATSISSGVSIIYLWFRKEPFRGQASRIAGLALLAVIVLATYATLTQSAAA